jgi:hypothetical protein
MDSYRTPPLQIELMLKVYYLAEPTIQNLGTGYSQKDFLRSLINAGMIEEFGTGDLVATERGRAWVALILSTPYPQNREEWFDPRTNESISRM